MIQFVDWAQVFQRIVWNVYILYVSLAFHNIKGKRSMVKYNILHVSCKQKIITTIQQLFKISFYVCRISSITYDSFFSDVFFSRYLQSGFLKRSLCSPSHMRMVGWCIWIRVRQGSFFLSSIISLFPPLLERARYS